MKKYVAALVGLLLSGYSCSQAEKAVNAIDTSRVALNKQQSDLIFDTVKVFPNNTEVALALIVNGTVKFVGIKRVNDSVLDIKNYNSVFEIGSISKVFTSTLLATFVSEDKVKLDGTIQNYLDYDFRVEEDITFQQLANHTSGFPRLPSNLDFSKVDVNNPYKAYDTEKLKDYLIYQSDLAQKPGLKHEYSNLGAGLLGYTLSEISKTSYEDLLQQKIFGTHKMYNSTSKRANINEKLIKGLDFSGKETSNWDFEALAGGGGIFSTTEDLSKFALAQFNSQSEVLTLTHKPTFKVSDNMSVGLGWFIIKRQNGNEVIWHNGGTGGYTSSMALDTNQKNGVIILSNISGLSEKSGIIDRLCFSLIKSLDND
jgi:CubicO group peptidase (beta-lactamase class C family)